MTWNNDDLTLYHGCTEQSVQPHNSKGLLLDSTTHGIDLEIGRASVDFGRGFYATTSERQAKAWANLQAKKLGQLVSAPKPLVLKFEINRNVLAGLETLVFTNENADYFPFVKYCRTGGKLHNRQGGYNSSYDVVYGPVCVWDQAFVMKDCDQISFHTERALKAIPKLSVSAVGDPSFIDARFG